MCLHVTTITRNNVAMAGFPMNAACLYYLVEPSLKEEDEPLFSLVRLLLICH